MSLRPLLVVFIHGFRGEGDGTFLDFPQRLSSILEGSLHPSRLTSVVVYPKFETRGELEDAVAAFKVWLVGKVADLVVEGGHEGGLREVDVVLCGHSMGGLIAADTTLGLVEEEISVQVRAVIAYDTPYIGVHPGLISRQAVDKANEITRGFGDATAVLGAAIPAARAFSGSRWGTWGAGAALAATAIGTGAAWYHKEKLASGLTWVKSHMLFASAVVNEEKMQERLEKMVDSPSLVFHGFYNKLIKDPARTFIKPPPAAYERFFTPLMSEGADEIEAHTSMFNPETNTGYYALGQETASLIAKAVASPMPAPKEDYLIEF